MSEFCDNCFKGVTHEGTPTGKWEKIGGVDCYVATPENQADTKAVVLFLPDVFGIQLPNNQLLISDFATNGFKTIGVDYFDGDPIPVEVMSPNYSGPPFDRATWFAKHGPPVAAEAVKNVIKALKAAGVEAFGATGYCYGARFVFNLAFENSIKASAVSHPSLLKVPDDLEKYLSSSKAPLLINSCTVDSQFPLESQAKANEILGDGKFGPGYKQEYFEGCEHGFAVRGDISNPKVKAGKEGAFKASVGWFKKYLVA
ncbi:hypothetical protein V5O48_013955 [Marasmius crinis-equi]|uniref:Dienelactone hydrolase domain-containing protein n=1 Tax=Marasmius crinis-equi TaxID=585013 RepID=A0ABR3EYL5_9AGAR